MMLLPKSQNELMRWLSISALVVLVTSYLGILFAPNLSIHLASDPQEPGLAGNWRGLFGHKNLAAGVTVMILFLGIFAIRCRAWLSGGAIVALSSLFLVYSAGKSSLTLCFAVLLLTSLTAVVRSFWARALMLLLPLLLLNLLSIGTVMFEGLAEIARLLPLDSTFTGRTDIWSFGLQSLQTRLATGYGFSAFWGSTAIQNLPEGKEWAGFASHSHNGYLDSALGMGLPGLALLFVLVVIEPLREFSPRRSGWQQRPADDGAAADLAVRHLSVVDGELLPRPRRSSVVHVPAGRVRSALSGAISGEGLTGSWARTASATSCHQPPKSNGACTGGCFEIATIRSA